MKKKFMIGAVVFGILTVICGFIVLYSWGTIDISIAIIPLLFFLACVMWVDAIDRKEKRDHNNNSVQ